MGKNEIREKMRALRRALTPEEIKERSALINSALFSIDEFKTARTVMVYISAFKEVDTSAIIDRLSAEGRKIVVPISNTDTCTITPSYIDGMKDMKRGAYGILEPVSIKKAEISDIDLIIVPGIAFDIHGGRCGFGKGYYDRLLCESGAKKIGLCYDFQLVEEIGTDAHDIPMDMIITERRIINVV